MSWTADEAYLAHHGIKGQRWGVRRFQEKDGDYTAAGRARYGIGDGQKKRSLADSLGDDRDRSGQIKRRLNELDKERAKTQYNKQVAEFKKNKKEFKNPDANTKKYDKTIAKSNKSLSDIKKETDHLLKQATANGYKIDSKQAIRDVKAGKQFFLYGNVSVGGARVYDGLSGLSMSKINEHFTGTDSRMEGTKYYVAKNK